jgi:hypothetical protein
MRNGFTMISRIAIGLFACTAVASCKKPGKLQYEISYNTSEPSFKRSGGLGLSDTFYTQFGNYITSVTPGVFTGRFQGMRFLDHVDPFNQVDVISYQWSMDDPRRQADFTNAATVSVAPEFHGQMRDEFFEADSVKFEFFKFVLDHFYQEVELPTAYGNLSLDQFHLQGLNYDTTLVKTGNMLKIDHYFFMLRLFDPWNNGPKHYVFGSTDSSYLVLDPQSYTNDNPDGESGSLGRWYVRSHQYDPLVLHRPPEGATQTVTTTLSFYVDSLIQIYAGSDNAPYTSDDVFVYAPNFWERLGVAVEVAGR